MNKQYKILMHFLLWICVFVPVAAAPIIIFIRKKDEIEKMMPDIPFDVNGMIWGMSFNVVKFLIVFYVFYFVIDTLLKKKQRNWKTISVGLIIIVALVVQKWFWDFLPVLNVKKLSFAQRLNNITFLKSVVAVIVTLLQGGIAMGVKAVISSLDEKKARKELETSNLKNELGMLRSQINPHFLFNTLNNIDTLIKKNPEKASELVIKLSDEMRYMLYDAKIDNIEIEQELNFLQNYVALQEIRINHKNPISSKIDIDNPHKKVPPMLFLPLVENAFKHGRFTNPEDVIQLEITLKERMLHFLISNPYDSNSSILVSHKGLGLDLVKRRLELIFQDNYKFEIRKEDQYFTVEFSIELEDED